MASDEKRRPQLDPSPLPPAGADLPRLHRRSVALRPLNEVVRIPATGISGANALPGVTPQRGSRVGHATDGDKLRLVVVWIHSGPVGR